MRLSSVCTSIAPLEYLEVTSDALALPQVSSPTVAEPSSAAVIEMSEEEVERRIQMAREAAAAEADQRMRLECEHVRKSAQDKVTKTLRGFDDERAEYFRRVEREVVQLALAIARKILHREAELDPTLLAALVRIAIDQMQCGSVVRIRVSAESVALWRRCGDTSRSSSQWEIVPDERLNGGDCIVETELGTANFGFEAQLRDVGDSLAQLLSHRPDEGGHHAASA